MKLDVHELINMPGYGKANVAVQKAGMWAPFSDDTERMDWLQNYEVKARNEDGRVVMHYDNFMSQDFCIRAKIDAAFVKTMNKENQQ